MSMVKKNLAVKVVLDTNVYISAILFGGNSEKIRKLSKKKLFDILHTNSLLKD